MARKKRKHDCADKVNALLAKRGDCLQRFITIGKSTSEKIAVATERKDAANWKRGSSWLMASYCPFCGAALSSSKEGS